MVAVKRGTAMRRNEAVKGERGLRTSLVSGLPRCGTTRSSVCLCMSVIPQTQEVGCKLEGSVDIVTLVSKRRLERAGT